MIKDVSVLKEIFRARKSNGVHDLDEFIEELLHFVREQSADSINNNVMSKQFTVVESYDWKMKYFCVGADNACDEVIYELHGVYALLIDEADNEIQIINQQEYEASDTTDHRMVIRLEDLEIFVHMKNSMGYCFMANGKTILRAEGMKISHRCATEATHCQCDGTTMSLKYDQRRINKVSKKVDHFKEVYDKIKLCYTYKLTDFINILLRYGCVQQPDNVSNVIEVGEYNIVDSTDGKLRYFCLSTENESEIKDICSDDFNVILINLAEEEVYLLKQEDIEYMEKPDDLILSCLEELEIFMSTGEVISYCILSGGQIIIKTDDMHVGYDECGSPVFFECRGAIVTIEQ